MNIIPHHFFQTALSVSVLAAFSVSAAAQDEVASAQEHDLTTVHVQGKRRDLNAEQLLGGRETLYDEDDLLSSDLKRRRSASLGQTLEQISGVQNNSFGTNNGLPQIRSLSGPRVYISENGLAVSDIASISGNLPTAVNPFLADKITVRKSSAAVLYGGSAVGGAVDVHTNLITDTLPDKPIAGKLEVSGGYNTPTLEVFRLDGKAGNFAWHLDGSNSKISEYKIPGNSKAAVCHDADSLFNPQTGGVDSTLAQSCQVNVRSESVLNRAYFPYVHGRYLESDGEAWLKQWLDDGYIDSVQDIYKKTRYYGYADNPLYRAGETHEKSYQLTGIEDISPNPKGKLTNSHAHNQSVSAGVSYIADKGHLGVGVSRHLFDYGVPGFAYLASNTRQDLAPINIQADQTRWIAEGLYRPAVSWLENVKVQSAYTDTDNAEYLGDHFANSLNSSTRQVRLELNHRPASFWRGTLGIDARRRHINGKGNDRFIPDSDTHEHAVFAVERLKWKQLEGELGWRFGKVRHQTDLTGYTIGRGLNEGYIHDMKDRRYTLHSGQAALTWQPWQPLRLNTRYSRSERAPEVNEIFASNRHFAILTNEQGDPRLSPEQAATWEFGGDVDWHNHRFHAAYYQTKFNNYLYLGHTGIVRDNIPVKEWRQSGTKINGLELEWKYLWQNSRLGDWETRIFADLVKNSPISQPQSADPTDAEAWKQYLRYKHDGAYMPNMPTSRYGVGLNWQKNQWQAALSLTRYQAQKRLGRNINPEISFGGYNVWDFYLSRSHKLSQNSSAEYFLDARNLGNAEIRPHNAILKHLAPQPGRNIRIGARLTF
ncbi:TonB-dependent receptor [Neisseria lisongii]|uniref:TonB-dependent receptor n=1 Tax=Neisseria lisongii TaxID=2912188 RepID=A0AAW5AL35_9NEIS|nr:TonB-dependent receptor [Neisseria lisongii]MCF7530572.1 TonB-dependent receptor [Neisseria lisongii]